MSIHLKKAFTFAKTIISAWSDHAAPRMGASVAFYTVFSIAPLFLIVLAIAGFCFGPEAAHKQLFGQIQGLVGSQGAEAIQAIVTAADKPKTGILATIAAVVTLIIGATGVFAELQAALNSIWNVRLKPGAGLRNFIKVRLLSFAMVVVIGFLLLVSLVISAALAALGKYLSGLIPEQEVLWHIVNFLISLGVITVLFALIFKVLPDVKIAWRDVWIGALITALLFDLGKFLIGLYLGRGSFASAYGAFGSLVVVLMWVYYSAQIIFLGAEFTRMYAVEYGSHVQPAPGAQFVEIQEVESKELDKKPVKKKPAHA